MNDLFPVCGHALLLMIEVGLYLFVLDGMMPQLRVRGERKPG